MFPNCHLPGPRHSYPVPQRNVFPGRPAVTCSVPCQRGFSLLELTIIVLILSIMAAAAAPFFYTSNAEKLDAAVDVQVEAMRFARTEALRVGKEIGFRQQNAQKRMRVFSIDTSTAPWTVVYDIYHPVSKKIWDINIDDHPYAAADTVSTTKVFRGTCNTPSNIYFDKVSGTARCTDPETVPLERYDVTLTLGNDSRTVSLNGFSGKVTVQ